MRHLLLRSTLAAFTTLAAAPAVNAHYLWIEPNGTQAKVYFGEYEEAARERSPGRLDEIPAPQAQVLSSKSAAPVALHKQADGFAFAPLEAGPRPLVVEESAVGVKDWTASGIGVVKPYFYARYQPGHVQADAPAMTLDILPLAQQGQFRVYFRGQPLPKAAVKIVAPNTWAQEGRTDPTGTVELPLPWAGQYIVQVIHLEAGSGEYEGKPYQAKRHRATLTYLASKGSPKVLPKQGAMQ